MKTYGPRKHGRLGSIYSLTKLGVGVGFGIFMIVIGAWWGGWA